MRFTKKTIRQMVALYLREGKTKQEIEDLFKVALKLKEIDIDDWSCMMESLYP